LQVGKAGGKLQSASAPDQVATEKGIGVRKDRRVSHVMKPAQRLGALVRDDSVSFLSFLRGLLSCRQGYGHASW
jgi:hypothetical protein